MDVTTAQLAMFLAATFLAAFVAGVSGFAFALVAAGVYLHFLPPLQTITLTVCYGLLVQGYGFWKLRHAFDWSRFWPFIVGSAPGIAIGIHVLRWANPVYIRSGIAIFLIMFAIYGLTRPAIKPINAGRLTDIAVGFASGLFGTMAGFPGIIIVIWCGMRGWSRDVQRGVFQPVSVAGLAMTAIGLAATKSIAPDTVYLFLAGLPVIAVGTWVGFRVYGRIDDELFRKIVLWLLMAAGFLLLESLL